MKLLSGSHLSYCSNIHPGEHWAEVANNLRTFVPPIKQKLCPNQPFGLGLRLSASASHQLQQEGAFEELCEILETLGAYVFTINGFPYGTFHGTRIKEHVYEPDWRSEERLTYTLELAGLLARLHTRGHTQSKTLSISTVPGCFRYGKTARAPEELIADNLRRCAVELARLQSETGANINLGLEPEPACLLETTEEAIFFIQEQLLSKKAQDRFGALRAAHHTNWEELIRKHVGVCFDTCHAAVQFEDPAQAVEALRNSGILVTKMQVTTALHLPRATPEALAVLRDFDDGQYLHQGTVALANGLHRFIDLPDALSNRDWEGAPWRVHFHVPVFLRNFGELASTQDDLLVILAEHTREPFTEHLEVETYTFSVLPEEYRPRTPAEAITSELSWTIEQLSA